MIRGLIFFLLLGACASLSTAAPDPVSFTLVDAEATGYGTFQSHNQKVVSNKSGVFMTHIRSRNEAYTAQQWRLSRSADGGATFKTIHEETSATNPPVIETDADANIYLIRPDFADGDSYLYRFLAADGYAKPLVSRIPKSAAGKFAMMIDLARKRLYYFSHNDTFHVVRFDGEVESSIQLLKGGPHAALQYPQLSLAADGVLHAAWTTQKNGVYMYWDIHHMESPDAGKTWRNVGGASIVIPAVADETGPAARVSLDDEFEVHTWLSSFMAKGGKLHFAYEAQSTPPREHYVRYDAATRKEEKRIQPEFKGESISLMGLDGFFASGGSDAASPLFFVSNAAGKLGALVSRDNGGSWHDAALGDRAFALYSIGGCRALTDDGYVIGSFTEQVGSTADPAAHSKVWFFKFQPGK